jgi:hypothetical protein
MHLQVSPLLWRSAILSGVHSYIACSTSDPRHSGTAPVLLIFLITLIMSQKWADTHFVPETLSNLGLVVHLGHQGRACASPLQEGRGTMCIVDTSGVHTVRVQYCGCQQRGRGFSRRELLMRSAWFPATWRDPRTAFTYNVLNDFHVGQRILQSTTELTSHRCSMQRRRQTSLATGVLYRARRIMRNSSLTA